MSSSNKSRCCQHLLSAIDMDDDSSLKVQKNFICDHCYGAFRSSYHLKRHILTHTGEQTFQVNVSTNSKLQCAVMLGSCYWSAGEKPYACDACDMRFIQRYHLDRHKRVHSGEKPYQCDRCHQVGCAEHFWTVLVLLRCCCLFFFLLFFSPLTPPQKTHTLLSLQNFSRTDRLLRHRRLCTVGVTKEESQFSQDTSAHPASWSPLQPSNNRLTVWHPAELQDSLTHSFINTFLFFF